MDLRILHGPLVDFFRRSLRDLSRMRSQHDGAPAHKSVQPCTFLEQTFDTRIIDYGGQQEWPPRSPHLSPLGFPKKQRESTSKSDLLNGIGMQICDTNYVAELTAGVSDAGSVLHFCGRQSF
ncbi:uncharacterized protein TNCV_4416511 [Trichonephila clavipes]|uniref:Uncharacterized protein n=1 Tax=Trichonephila clavipes TaxID=2585209 RepID=A0A8X6S9T8_TRICX|nr:uncharacterized protein TNCV_4416511 [Trichonephila clavipes]